MAKIYPLSPKPNIPPVTISLISNIATGIICGLGSNGYILAINAMHELLKNGNR